MSWEKIAIRVALLCILALLLSYGVSVAMGFLNEKDDSSVAFGAAILIVFASFGVALCFPWAGRSYEVILDRLRKMNLVIPICLLVALLSGCTRVGPGYVGIKISMAGSQKGVSDIPAVTGWAFYNFLTQEVFTYPTFLQTAKWTRSKDEGGANNEEVTFASKEGLMFTGDISLSYQLTAENIPAFYVKFRSDDLSTFTHGYLRNIARDAFNEEASKYSVEEIYGLKKEDLVTAVKKRINSQVANEGVTIEQFGFIGAPRPPETVIASINSKISATQNAIRAENELRMAKAEAAKVIAKASGEAEANVLLSKSLTPELVQWRYIQILQDATIKWDGKRPMVEGVGSGLLMQIPLPSGDLK